MMDDNTKQALILELTKTKVFRAQERKQNISASLLIDFYLKSHEEIDHEIDQRKQGLSKPNSLDQLMGKQ